ncbi:hypothetical protein AA14337_3092 [Acetobacter malorum DSM 14337]|uniref:Uncharacterized protein n=1 Tax=Acetobacter malorum DSM 14337 TaxID=1307910 RepID=A0ABQ0PZL7_9PROT|nr:hypothetical protein [Acetobacter malorum]KXV05678.1 hypothetical protein AD930_11120 [Acetobacter malorum]GBQ85518.1 hypothetical protein AA14337_3092 [Acetobacter malorum DSM 14337]
MTEHQTREIAANEHHVKHQKAMAARKPVWEVYHPNNAGRWSARMVLTHPHPVPTDCLIHGQSREEVRAKMPPGLRLQEGGRDLPPGVEEAWVGTDK